MSPIDATALEQAPVTIGAQPASDHRHDLAESPVWDPDRRRLLWVDITAGRVHAGTLTDRLRIRSTMRLDLPDVASAVAVAADGTLLVCGSGRLWRLHDGEVVDAGTVFTEAGRRFNDGKPDPRGRFLVGTLGPSNDQELMRLDGNGTRTILEGDLTLSNGLGWSPDGSLMYSIDTLAGRVYVRPYEPGTGAVGERAVLTTVTAGYPDGMTVDSEGCLWVALWGAGCVIRLSAAGELLARIPTPAPHTTSVCFAGDDLGTLVITTATSDMSPAELAAAPLSGRLFTARPGVRGAPVARWDGRL